MKDRLVHPSETKSLSRITADKKQLLGIPHGNYWLFKIVSGNINAYHVLSEEGITEVTHIQKGNGPIEKLTPYSIIQMVGGDPEVLKLISHSWYYEAIVLYNTKRR